MFSTKSEVEYAVLFYNQAVILYYLRQYNKAITVLSNVHHTVASMGKLYIYMCVCVCICIYVKWHSRTYKLYKQMYIIHDCHLYLKKQLAQLGPEFIIMIFI